MGEAGRGVEGLPFFLMRKLGLREGKNLLKVTQRSAAGLGQIFRLPCIEGNSEWPGGWRTLPSPHRPLPAPEAPLPISIRVLHQVNTQAK